MKLGLVLLVCFAVTSVAHPALAQDSKMAQDSPTAPRDSVVTKPSQDRVDWPQVGMGFSTAVGNLFYIPGKIAYGALGGLAGGAAYVFSRGDHDMAHKIWRNTLGGDYIITARMLKGQEPLHFVGSSWDSAQADARSSRQATQPITAPTPRSEATASAEALAKRNTPKETAAGNSSSSRPKLPRANHGGAPAEWNPQGIRSSLPDQDRVPRFCVVAQ